MSLPLTPFRCCSESEPGLVKIEGLESLVRDTLSVAAMLEMIERRASRYAGRACSVTLECQAESMLLVGDRLMCKVKWSTRGLVQAGLEVRLL